jgi:2-polyprenyl-3-methyl-5-hydroxy-6-metoxy-1,4-benzoquinol methylase
MQHVYDDLYLHNNYNDPIVTGCETKWQVISPKIKNIRGLTSVVDIGCGRGFYLRKMIDAGIDAFGIEFSTECCLQYLQDVKHANVDIATYAANTSEKWMLAICMDMLEHITYEDVDNVIESVAKISSCGIFGISNHSDVMNGVELHIIQQNSIWWEKLLHKKYSHVEKIYDDRRFFAFYCF